MKFAIGFIVWPSGARAANLLLKCFMLKALELSRINLSDGEIDPAEVVRGYVAGDVSAAHCKKLAADWLARLDSVDRVREFQDKNILLVRLANSLLDVDEGGGMSYADELGWFIELLGFMGLIITGRSGL